MRNSHIKNQRNTTANHHFEKTSKCPIISPQQYDLIKQCPNNSNHGNHFNNNNNAYQSSYNYFAQRMGIDDRIQMQNAGKVNHQRYMSLGNSRVTIKSGHSAQVHKLSNCQSSPYLLNFNKKQSAPIIQTPKPTSRNSSKCPSQQNTPQNQPIGLKININNNSIKNYFPNAFTSNTNNNTTYNHNPNSRSSCMKQSVISTTNQTQIQNTNANYSTHSQGFAQQKQQLVKYFHSHLQKITQSFKYQINQQKFIIQSLKDRIDKLNANLNEKEKVISELRARSKYQANGMASKKGSQIQKKIDELDDIIKQISNKFGENGVIQDRLNFKIDKIMEYVVKNNINNLGYGSKQLNKQISKLAQNLNKYSCELKNLKKSLKQTEQLHPIVETVVKKFSTLLTLLPAPLQQTGQFPQPQPQSLLRMSPNSVPQLNDSASYFFHPSELNNENMVKIQELFVNRHGKAIECYLDVEDRVRYRDTGTFLFNKKGDIVRLGDCEKKYCVKRGFITNF